MKQKMKVEREREMKNKKRLEEIDLESMNEALKPLDVLNKDLAEMKEKTKWSNKTRSLSREPKKVMTKPSPTKKNDSFRQEIEEVDEDIDENIE
jgi:hypothetical protein